MTERDAGTGLPLIICEDLSDPLVTRVIDHLREQKLECVVVETTKLSQTSLRLSADSTSGCQTEIAGIDASSPDQRIWCRRPTWPHESNFSDSDAGVRSFRATQYALGLSSLYGLGRGRAMWMNNPADESRLDQNKVLQQMIASEAGLRTAPLICTDDPDYAIAFARKFEEVAVKPAAGFVARYEGGEHDGMPMTFFTRRVKVSELADMMDSIRACPVLIQPYIHKRYELRITVVNRTCLTARIESQMSTKTSVDWRNYDLANTPHVATSLPPRVETAVLEFMTMSKLRFAAIDVIVDLEGDYWFLEANPSGQYGWIEDLTGLPISRAIAQWLTGDEFV